MWVQTLSTVKNLRIERRYWIVVLFHGRFIEMPGGELLQTDRFKLVEQRLLYPYRTGAVHYIRMKISYCIVLGDRYDVSVNFTCGVTSATVPGFKTPRFLIKIMGGRESEKFHWPWQVAVLDGFQVYKNYATVKPINNILFTLYQNICVFAFSGGNLWRHPRGSWLGAHSCTLF